MGVTAYISDIHGNVGYTNAVVTVMNYLNSKYKTSTDIVCAGDFTQDTSMEQEEDKAAKVEMSNSINSVLKGLKGGKTYGVLGNHDPDAITKSLSSVTFLEYNSATIDGKNYYGVPHSGYSMHNGGNIDRLNSIKSLDGKLAEIEKALSTADYLVAHEGPHKNLSVQNSMTGEKINDNLVNLANKSKASIICGHIHKTKFEKLGEKKYGIVSSGVDKNGGAIFRVYVGNKELYYELSNNKILGWANEIDKNGKYAMIEGNKEDFSKFILQKYPELPEFRQHCIDNPDDLDSNNTLKDLERSEPVYYQRYLLEKAGVLKPKSKSVAPNNSAPKSEPPSESKKEEPKKEQKKENKPELKVVKGGKKEEPSEMKKAA